MSVYLIGFLRAKDWKWYREYRATSEPLVAKHGGRYLIKGGPLSWLEGDAAPPDDASTGNVSVHSNRLGRAPSPVSCDLNWLTLKAIFDYSFICIYLRNGQRFLRRLRQYGQPQSSVGCS